MAATESDWGFHPVVFHAALACDIFWLRRSERNVARRRFSGKYSEAKEKFLRGDLLDSPHCALSKKKIEDKKMEILDENSVQFLVEERVNKIKNSSEFKEKILSGKAYLNMIRENLSKSITCN